MSEVNFVYDYKSPKFPKKKQTVRSAHWNAVQAIKKEAKKRGQALKQFMRDKAAEGNDTAQQWLNNKGL